MDTNTFFNMFGQYERYCEWATSQSNDMSDVWQALTANEWSIHGSKWPLGWLLWTMTRPGILKPRDVRMTALQFIRETPLLGGGKVWNLLKHEQSRNAIIAFERSLNGDANEQQLTVAVDGAYAAAQRESETKIRLSPPLAVHLGFSNGSAAASAALAVVVTTQPMSDGVSVNEYIAKASARISREAALLALEQKKPNGLASISESACVHRILQTDWNVVAAQCRIIGALPNPFQTKNKD